MEVVHVVYLTRTSQRLSTCEARLPVSSVGYKALHQTNIQHKTCNEKLVGIERETKCQCALFHGALATVAICAEIKFELNPSPQTITFPALKLSNTDTPTPTQYTPDQHNTNINKGTVYAATETY